MFKYNMLPIIISVFTQLHFMTLFQSEIVKCFVLLCMTADSSLRFSQDFYCYPICCLRGRGVY